MNRSAERPQFADIDWLPDGTAYCRRHRDRYGSAAGAIGESEHVFLRGNELARRWRRLDRDALFIVGEIGFGAGRNFLCAWSLWRRSAPPSARLHYLATERYPMREGQLRRALAIWPQPATLAKTLLAAWPPPLPGTHRLSMDGGRVQLSLLIGDATETLAEFPVSRGVDAWFLDGFAPARNADAWSPALCRQLRRHSSRHASCATYSAAGLVRRQLRDSGFALRRIPGYGDKAESLRGRLLSGGRRHRHRHRPGSALVVGAGIAGATTARQLAERGLAVTVLERSDGPAQGASGQPAVVLYPRFSASWTPQARFALAAYLHALRHYRQLLEPAVTSTGAGGFPGLIQLACDAGLARRCRELATRYGECSELLGAVDAAQASQLAGVALNNGGLFYPGGGWLVPAAVCEALLGHPSIHCLFGQAVQLRRVGQQWRAQTKHGTPLAEAPCAVLATGTTQPPAPPLPLRVLRGQSSDIAATPASSALRKVLCHRGYLLPARTGRQQLGSTYSHDDHSIAPHTADHQRNLEQLTATVPALAAGLPPAADCAGSVGFRHSSPDHLPLVGGMRGQASLYLNLGHGSAGVAQAPLCAELLACRILGEPPPLAADLLRALAPERFGAAVNTSTIGAAKNAPAG